MIRATGTKMITVEQWVEIVSKYKAGVDVNDIADHYPGLRPTYIYMFITNLRKKGIEINRPRKQRVFVNKLDEVAKMLKR